MIRRAFSAIWKISSFDWRISGKFQLRFAIFCVLRGKRHIVEISVLLRKRAVQQNCQNAPVIWRKCNFDWMSSDIFYIMLVIFLRFNRKWGDKSGHSKFYYIKKVSKFSIFVKYLFIYFHEKNTNLFCLYVILIFYIFTVLLILWSRVTTGNYSFCVQSHHNLQIKFISVDLTKMSPSVGVWRGLIFKK